MCCSVFLQLDVVEYYDYRGLNGDCSWMGEKKWENTGGKRGWWMMERAKAIIRGPSTFDVMSAENTRKDRGFAALLAAKIGSDFETEGRYMDGAIAWNLFWTRHNPQSIKKGQMCLFLSAAGQKKNHWSRTSLV